MPTLAQLANRAAASATVEDYHLVRKRLAARPESLDNDALGILKYFGGDRAVAEAQSAREAARHTTTELDPAVLRHAPLAGALPTAPAASEADKSAYRERVKAAVSVFRDVVDVFDGEHKELTVDKVMAFDEFLHTGGDATELMLFTIAAFCRKVNERNQQRNKRIDELEARPASLPYRGVWKAETAYRQGELCTFDGSLWFCHALSYSRPGTDSTWQLCVKRGRDAR